jgi:hypothetical protein
MWDAAMMPSTVGVCRSVVAEVGCDARALTVTSVEQCN